MVIFLVKICSWGKILGIDRKTWIQVYRCIATNLPLCNDTIIVLKLTLLHSVYVITNFVIPKRDKQTKNHTFSSTAGARPTIRTILDMLIVIDEVRPIFAPPPLTLFDPISSFAAMGYWKFKGKCHHRALFVLESDQVKNLKATHRPLQTLRFRKKYCKRVAPEAQSYGHNSTFLQFWGCIPTFLPR